MGDGARERQNGHPLPWALAAAGPAVVDATAATCVPLPFANLQVYAWGGQAVPPFDWAVRFERHVRERLLAGDDDALVAYETCGRDAMRSVPTANHYLPLLYVVALRRQGEPVRFPVEGGSISMLTVRIG